MEKSGRLLMGSWQQPSQDAKDLVRTNKKCNQRSCLSNFFRNFFLGLAAYFTSEAKASSRFSSCREPQDVPDNDSSGKAGFPLAIGTKLHEWCSSTRWFCCCSSIFSCRGSRMGCELAWCIVGFSSANVAG